MSEKIHIDANIVRLLFYKYKNILLPVLGIAISWFVFFRYEVPQIQNFFANASQVQSSEQTLAIMAQNYNTIVQLSDNDIARLSTIANHALPTTKDYAEILTDISLVVARSGVSLNDYSFNVGDITSSAITTGGENGIVDVSLNIVGTSLQIKTFLTVLSQQFPLSDVSSVSLGGAGTTIPVVFYYSPSTTPTFTDTSRLPILSTSQRQLLLDLEKQAEASASAQ